MNYSPQVFTKNEFRKPLNFLINSLLIVWVLGFRLVLGLVLGFWFRFFRQNSLIGQKIRENCEFVFSELVVGFDE